MYLIPKQLFMISDISDDFGVKVGCESTKTLIAGV